MLIAGPACAVSAGSLRTAAETHLTLSAGPTGNLMSTRIRTLRSHRYGCHENPGYAECGPRDISGHRLAPIM